MSRIEIHENNGIQIVRMESGIYLFFKVFVLFINIILDSDKPWMLV